MQFDKDIASEFKDLFLRAREILLSYDGIVETKKERITSYSNENGGICHMRTMPYGVDFGFLKGAKCRDCGQGLPWNRTVTPTLFVVRCSLFGVRRTLITV